MIRKLSHGRKSALFALKRNCVIRQDLIHPQSVRTDNRVVGNHHRLVTVADVISEQSPFAIAHWPNDEHRFLLLDDAYDETLRLEDETVVLLEDGAAFEGGRKFKSTVGAPPRPCAQTFLPSQRDEVASEALRGVGYGIQTIKSFGNRK